MELVGVECSFGADGRVRVARLTVGGKWSPVEQGRQWRDQTGLHVLILLDGSRPRELVLRQESLTWVMKDVGAPDSYVV